MAMQLYLLLGAASLAALAPAATMFKVHELRRRESRMPAATALENVSDLLTQRRGDLTRTEERLADLQAAVAERDQAKGEAAVWLDKLQVARNELEGLAGHRLELDQVKQDLARERDALTLAKQNRDEAESTHSRLTREVADLEQRRAALQASLTAGEDRKTWLDRVIAELGAKGAALQAQVADLQKQLEDRRQQLQDVDVELKGKRGELGTLGQRIEDANRSLASLQNQEASLKTEIEQLTGRKTTLTREVAGLENTKSELQRLNAQVLAAKAEVAKLGGEETRLKQTVDGLAKRTNELKGEIAQLEGRRDEIGRREQGRQEEEEKRRKDAIQELLQQPATLGALKLRRDEVSEDAALDGVRRHLDALGLQFSQRTLNAFHTCLKIADISPLTVLAGISGTGKSELPRRYAEGMGIHFLQLAVQPRWDSPQDLFGFYNYLEHRYKATELARLMVHLDPYNWPEARPFEGHMAIALLDEMNLARVEYYFSEFLSRLEVRRGGESIEQQRQQAEIELDLGPVGAGRRNRVYPSSRLLFVGTMNEDESTQTLSDKVVDRANVLRFSRPEKLSAAPVSGVGKPADRFLHIDTWRNKWRRSTIAPSHTTRVEDWINRLNAALQGLGRPFGHRLNQAILLYMANYPGMGSDESLRIAFADQLEQRVLPKLRGVEKDDGENNSHLDQIHRLIVQDLKDDALGHAFEAARGRELFLWNGCNRAT